MGRPAINFFGQKIGRWTVLFADADSNRGSGIHRRWICVCECGTIRSVISNSLRKPRLGSCGCAQKEQVTQRNTKHGEYGTAAYERNMSAIKNARKKRAMPKWANLDEIKRIYKDCPEGYEVDHIVPLAGRNVSGLHVSCNLQYLTVRENQSKKNKWVIE